MPEDQEISTVNPQREERRKSKLEEFNKRLAENKKMLSETPPDLMALSIMRMEDEHHKALNDLRYAKYTDQLTKASTRMGLEDALQEGMEEMRKSGKKFSVAIIDLIRFKDVNDNLGHGTGDKVLTLSVKKFRELFRETDLVTRFGGDEFVIVFPDTDQVGAEKTKERFLEDLNEEKKKPDSDPLLKHVSPRISAREWKKGDTISEFIDELDKEMYEKKRGGGITTETPQSDQPS